MSLGAVCKGELWGFCVICGNGPLVLVVKD